MKIFRLAIVMGVLGLGAYAPSRGEARMGEAPGMNEFIGSKYVPEWAGFTPTGSMNVSRRIPEAILLNNGLVLAAGGSNGSTCVASAELYNPSSGTWSPTGSMNAARCGHTVTLLLNGMVLAAGGSNPGPVTSAELYNPSTGVWSLTGSMGAAREEHTATLLDDGTVVVAGGSYEYEPLHSAETYNPATGIWSPAYGITYARWFHEAVLLQNGHALIIGGVGEGDAILARNEEYFPTPRSWYSAGEMNHGRISHSAALLNDGRVLAAGGYSGSAALASAELYNPTTLSWSETGGMNSARFQHSLTVLGNGLALAAGGSDGSAALASAELYHPESGSWSFTASMNLSRTEHFATRLNDTQVLVGGGWNGTELPYFSSSEIGSFVPANHLTGTLILPSGWIRSSSFTVQFSGDTSDAALKDGALSSDGSSWAEWIGLSAGVFITRSWEAGCDGIDLPVYLRARDIYDQTATVISGTVDVDATAPTAAVDPLSAQQASFTFPVSWEGNDATSGVEDYDVQYKDGGGAWTDWVMGTTELTAEFTGEEDHTYFFRVRARDAAGNLGGYSGEHVQTTVDVYKYDVFLAVVGR